MAQLKDIKERINSVAKTKKMTQAMKMVAAAKFKRFSKVALTSRIMMESIDHNLNQVLSEDFASCDSIMLKPMKSNKKLVVLISGDRGLCGGFNTNMFKFSQQYIDNSEVECELIIYGKKAYQYFRRKNITIKHYEEGITEKFNKNFIEKLAQELVDIYETGEYGSITLLYNEFKSAVSTNLISKQLLPISYDKEEESDLDKNILVEPSVDQVLTKLGFMYLSQSMYNSFLESFAAEQGARMAAMDSATDNAADMIKELTLIYNRQRQAQITSELAEIVAGAEALSQ